MVLFLESDHVALAHNSLDGLSDIQMALGCLHGGRVCLRPLLLEV